MTNDTGRHNVEAFLDECDDVIASWEGSADSATWTADGSHQHPLVDESGHTMVAIEDLYGLFSPYSRSRDREAQEQARSAQRPIVCLQTIDDFGPTLHGGLDLFRVTPWDVQDHSQMVVGRAGYLPDLDGAQRGESRWERIWADPAWRREVLRATADSALSSKAGMLRQVLRWFVASGSHGRPRDLVAGIEISGGGGIRGRDGDSVMSSPELVSLQERSGLEAQYPRFGRKGRREARRGGTRAFPPRPGIRPRWRGRRARNEPTTRKEDE